MSIRAVVVLAAAALRVHSVALNVAAGSSPGGPFSEPFDDFFDNEPSERTPESVPQEDDSMVDGLRLGESREDRPRKRRRQRRSNGSKPWIPPPRDGDFPFAGPMPSPHWENRLLVAPDRKFAFCYIEKNACTQFNLLVNGLNGMRTDDKIPFWKSNSDGKFKYFKVFQAHQNSQADGWSTSIFVREPTERFLSAWLSKCDAWEYGGIDCLGPRITNLSLNKKVELFEKMVVELLPQYMAKAQATGAFNAHYDPQHLFCGGRNMSEYAFVGLLEGSPASIHKQVKHMMSVYAHAKPQSGAMRVASRLFPEKARAGHKTNTVDLIKAFYRNRTILQMVMDQYARDYDWAGPQVREAWAQARRANLEGASGSSATGASGSPGSKATTTPATTAPPAPGSKASTAKSHHHHHAKPQAATAGKAASGAAPRPGLPGLPVSHSTPGAAPAPKQHEISRKDRYIQEKKEHKKNIWKREIWHQKHLKHQREVWNRKHPEQAVDIE
jgi:hypothetical protein